MRLHEPVILAEGGHDRDRLGGREREVVQMAPPALDLAVHRQAVRALPGTQPLAGHGMEALSNRLELLFLHLADETELRGAAALPVADHVLPFGVVVAVHERWRRVALPVRHRPNRQHARLPCARSARWNISSCSLERDTIPKPSA